MNGFEDGYDFFRKNAAYQYEALEGEEYIESIEDAVQEMLNSMIDFASGNNKADSIMGGDMAEFWHAGTFNINAVVKRSEDRAIVPKVNDLGSSDIELLSGKKYGLKYYSTAVESAKEQASSIYQHYRKHGGKKTIEEYLKDHPEFSEKQLIFDPLYKGQYRLVPEDQLQDVKAWLRRKYLEEVGRGDGLDKQYKDALEMLADVEGHAVIENEEGIKSFVLTKQQSTNLSKLAKENKIDLKEWGLSTENLVSYRDIFDAAFDAGTTAAAIEMVLKVVPEIFKAFDYLLKNGEINVDSLVDIGGAAVTGYARGFIIGSISYALTASMKAGLLGPQYKSLNPHIIGAAAIIIFDSIGNAIKVANGKMSEREMADAFLTEAFISICTLLGGSILELKFGKIGYLVGSFLGSAIGGLIISAGKQVMLSVCVKKGYTFFGLVEQNYEIPEIVLEKLGVDIFHFDRFIPYEFEFYNANDEIDWFDFYRVTYETLDFVPVRRGIIGVFKVGYVLY